MDPGGSQIPALFIKKSASNIQSFREIFGSFRYFFHPFCDVSLKNNLFEDLPLPDTVVLALGEAK